MKALACTQHSVGRNFVAVSDEARWSRLKCAIWIYLVLLVFEGALRKWVLPGLSTPLLVVRDPVAAFILFEAFRLRLVPQSPIFYGSIAIAVVALFMAIVFGHGNPYVALYGARPLLLHLPAMFVMARVIDRIDLLRMGRFIVIVSIAMTVLVALQFYSPQSAFVNWGTGGEGSSAGFSGAMGYFRPPGTFSFTNGLTLFYSLQAAFVFYFWLNPNQIHRSVLVAGTLALLIALPLSISRALIFQCIIVVAFACVAAMTRPKLMLRGILVSAILVIALLSVSSNDHLRTAIDVLTTRFVSASESEGGVDDVLIIRYLGGLLVAFADTSRWPFWGVGIGMGSNAGAMILSGETQFLVAENEWQRVVGELGFLMGFLVIAIRLVMIVSAAVRSGRALLLGDLLPWMLLSNAATSFPQGGWAQPTSMGFSMMVMAFLLASLRSRPEGRARNRVKVSL